MYYFCCPYLLSLFHPTLPCHNEWAKEGYGGAQAFTPIVTMVALFVAGLEAPTRRLISAVLLIAFGTAMASYGELSFSLIGVVVMFLSECFESTRLVMTQILLVGLKFHPSVSLFPPFLCDIHYDVQFDKGCGAWCASDSE